MTLILVVVGCLVLVAWTIGVVDIFKRDYPRQTKAAWLCLVVLLPIVGSLIYWYSRKETPEEVEMHHLADADRRRSAGPMF